MTNGEQGPIPVVLSWSGGKDSTMALHALRRDPRYEVAGLQTTVSADFDRVVMQGVRRSLVQRQADALGLELQTVTLPSAPTNEVYERTVADALGLWRSRGVDHVAYGDLFLDDIRAFREGVVARAGMRALFPVWTGAGGTGAFMRRFLDLGFAAVVVSLDPERLDSTFAGRAVDGRFLDELPGDVDPAGENGEFHTFVHDGPGFTSPVAFRHGQDVRRDGFLYHDLLEA